MSLHSSRPEKRASDYILWYIRRNNLTPRMIDRYLKSYPQSDERNYRHFRAETPSSIVKQGFHVSRYASFRHRLCFQSIHLGSLVIHRERVRKRKSGNRTRESSFHYVVLWGRWLKHCKLTEAPRSEGNLRGIAEEKAKGAETMLLCDDLHASYIEK